MPLTLNPDTKTPKLKAVDFNPFTGPNLLKIVPTTPSQVEIWLSCIIGGDDANRSYNESVSLDLSGHFSECALVQALETLIERHEILRSTFSNDGKSICIHESFPLELELIDISDMPPSEQRTYVTNVHRNDADRTFDLLNGPLFRSYLITLSEEHHVLKLSAHHIVCDGWSFGILLENISKIYNSIVNKESLRLDDVTPYSTYAKELSEYSASKEFQETEEYWLNQFSGEVPVLNVPTDKPRPTTRTFKSKREDFTISKELIEKVKHTGATAGASLVSTLIAAFEAYLHLITRQDTIVLGIPAAGQNATGHYELVGHCVNLLPLKSRPKGEQSFVEYLSERKSQILDAYDHQQFTFGTLMQKLNIARDSSRIPLVPVIFNIDMGMDANVAFSGLTHSLSNNPRNYENFEIFLNITGTEQALTFEWSYNAFLFERSTVQRMMKEFEGLLNGIVFDPKVKLTEISIGRKKPIDQLSEWNKTRVAYPRNTAVTNLIDSISTESPLRKAIEFKKKTTSFGQLHQQSNQLANYLISIGVKKGDIVGLLVDRSTEMIVSLLSIMKAGAAYLPLDPSYPKGRIEYMLEDSSVKHLLTSSKYASGFSTQIEPILIEEVWPNTKSYSSAQPPVALDGDDLAYVLYTSGSTGRPKGVQIEHHSLTNFLLSFKNEPGIRLDDNLLAITTISFDISATELFLPLIAGASLLLVDSNTARDGRELLRILEEENITIMQATPTTWQLLINADWDKRLPLKAICGGESLSKDLASKLLNRVSELWNVYGPTETTVWSSIKRIENEHETITIGRPISNTQIFILDEFGNPLTNGQAGEIFIAGDGLARGYLHRDNLTAERFVRNPFGSENSSKMYATGDLGYFLEDGEIVCLGRKDAQVKIRGHRIELGEIEYNIVQQTGIKDAVVTAQGDSENQNLVAYIVPDEKDSSSWINRWDDLYTLGIKSEEDKPLEEQNLDIAIISQYNTEKDIHEHGMEWTKEGLKRIKSIGAKKIIELGTGGGHLLFELAPGIERYIATDYSEVAINKLNEKLALNPEKWNHVKAYKAPADDFSAIPDQDYDLVFFHGVIQYFPTLDYLVKVLEPSVNAVRDGGCVHIGDCQTLNAISMHFASDQLKLSNDTTSLGEFRKIVKYRVQKEEEISIDPGFFYFLPKIIPAITAVDVQIRGGDLSNEGTKCHYDIWLYVGATAPEVIKTDVSQLWSENSSIQWISENLASQPGKVVLIKAIPNQRVCKDFALSQLMQSLPENVQVDQLKRDMDEMEISGINPTDLWELGEKMGYQTHVRWSNDGSDGNIEVVYIPIELRGCLPEPPSNLSVKMETEYFRAKKEAVELLDVPEHQIQIWKNELKKQLPDYMVPSMYVALNHFPTTANGKIDRKGLPVPVKQSSKTLGSAFIAPRNETEKLICGIWCELLSLDEISIQSNFFELGGHSLIAVRVMLLLEKEAGIRLPISTLFENSTIEKLAKLITGEKEQSRWHSLVPIKTSGTKTPVYLVHGGGFNVLTFEPFSKHMDPEQPIYALQGLGLYDKSKLLPTIEEIASFYISEMVESNPTGPYSLGGYCSGGIIAFEMARQLLLSGKEVKFIAMLDTNCEYFDRERPISKSIRNYIISKIKIGLFGMLFIAKHPRQFWWHLKAHLKGRFWPQDRPTSIHQQANYYETEVDEHYVKAFENYTIKPFELTVHLLKAKEKTYHTSDSETYGWKRIALGGVNTYTMEGDHNTFLTFPNEKRFARTFQNIIDKNDKAYTDSSSSF